MFCQPSGASKASGGGRGGGLQSRACRDRRVLRHNCRRVSVGSPDAESARLRQFDPNQPTRRRDRAVNCHDCNYLIRFKMFVVSPEIYPSLPKLVADTVPSFDRASPTERRLPEHGADCRSRVQSAPARSPDWLHLRPSFALHPTGPGRALRQHLRLERQGHANRKRLRQRGLQRRTLGSSSSLSLGAAARLQPGQHGRRPIIESTGT